MILTKDKVEDTLKGVEINSREELQSLAKQENLNINWSEFWTLWDSLVEKTKQDITNDTKSNRQQKVYALTPHSVYLQEYNNAKEAANAFGISPEQINVYIRSGKPYKKGKVLFLRVKDTNPKS